MYAGILLVGLFICGIGVIFFVVEPTTNDVCAVRWFFLNLGLILLCGGVFSRSYQLKKIHVLIKVCKIFPDLFLYFLEWKIQSNKEDESPLNYWSNFRIVSSYSRGTCPPNFLRSFPRFPPFVLTSFSGSLFNYATRLPFCSHPRYHRPCPPARGIPMHFIGSVILVNFPVRFYCYFVTSWNLFDVFHLGNVKFCR